MTSFPEGFFALGFAEGCEGGLLASPNGLEWSCAAPRAAFGDFVAAAAATSGELNVVVGTTFFGDGDSAPPPSGTIWYREP